MSVKLADTLVPMGDFPAVESENVGIDIDGTSKSIQQAYEDGDLSGSGTSIQVDTLPLADSSELSNIYQFIGSTGTYKNGYFYRCDSFSYLGWEDGSSNVVYTKDLENAIDGKVYILSGGTYTEVGTITELADDNSTMTYDDGNGNTVDCTRNNSYDVSDAGYTWTEIVYGSNLQEGDGIDITNDTISVVNRLVVTDTMPTAGASLLDATRLYVGTTTSDFNKGGIYQCQSDGEGGYKWVLISQADVDLSQYKKIYINEQAEWDELTTEEKTSYDMATITDDIATGFPVLSDVVLDGDENPVTSNAVYNAFQPDWSNVHDFTSTEMANGYTCPSNGQVFIQLLGATASMSVNSIILSSYTGASATAITNVSCCVGKGDVIRATNASLSTGDIHRCSFVPWKS